MTQTVIHVRCNASGKATRVKREGRDTIILPSFAAKADTVLNGILYPKAELEKSYTGLNRTPAPLGHPMVNGAFMPALDPEAQARTSIFAWNENARWDGDRIALDVVIDETRAKESEGGRKVLNAIEKQKPISTSTGLHCTLGEPIGEGHDSVAQDIEWDHVAILLDEKPAISTNDGVGIFVNSSSQDSPKIPVINSTLEQQADEEVGYAAMRLAQALERKERASETSGFLAKILDAIGIGRATPQVNESEDTMADENQNTDLSKRVDALSEEMGKMPETIANAVTAALKPLTDAQAATVANAKAKDEAELAEHRTAIVKANIMDEAAAGELTLNAARALAPKAKAGKAANLNPALNSKDDADEFAGVDLNADMEAK